MLTEYVREEKKEKNSGRNVKKKGRGMKMTEGELEVVVAVEDVLGVEVGHVEGDLVQDQGKDLF